MFHKVYLDQVEKSNLSAILSISKISAGIPGDNGENAQSKRAFYLKDMMKSFTITQLANLLERKCHSTFLYRSFIMNDFGME